MLRNKYTYRTLFFDFFKENLLLTTGVFCVGILSIASALFIPLLIGKYYQLALNSNSSRGKILDVFFGEITQVDHFFMLFGSIILARFCFNYSESYLVGISNEKFAKSLRNELFRTQLNSNFSDFEKKASGNYLLRYSGDLNAITNYLTKGIIGFFNDLVFLCLSIGLFFVINPYLAWIIVVAFPVIFLSIILLNLKLKKYTVNRRNIRSENLGFVATRLQSLFTIKVLNRESVEQQQFEKRSEKLYQNGIAYYRLYALITSLLPLLLYAMLGLLLLAAYRLNQDQTNSIEGSQIIVFIMLTISVISILRRILKVNIVWQTGRVSVQKLLLILNSNQENAKDLKEFKITEGRIELKQGSLFNSDEQVSFDDLNLVVPHFGIYQLSGNQGTGKSTVFKLLMGIYDLKSGSILLDGININEISRKSLRKQITLVSGEMILIGKTIFEAISYSKKPEKRENAQKLLVSLGFFDSNFQSIDDPIIQGGKNLSAGQRKLLMIARALLTRKKIILLDEPFSDLDESHKNKVIDFLDRLRLERTILIIDKSKNDRLFFDDVFHLSNSSNN